MTIKLTKREYFAALAMQNMATRDHGNYSAWDLEHGSHLDHPKWVAQAAVNYADALIKELKTKGEKNETKNTVHSN